MLARLDQSDDLAAELHALELEREAVSHRVIVRCGELVAQPEAVAVLIICSAVRDEEGRYIEILAHVQRERLVLLSLDIKIDGQIPRRLIHAVDLGDPLQVVSSKALFRIQAIIGVVSIVKKSARIHLDRAPFHIEAEEDSHAERDHDDHGDELRLIAPRGSKQLAYQHHHSTSSALMGSACSSIERILPFLTRITTSAILAMLWLWVTITMVLP